MGELQGEWVSKGTITFSKRTDVSEREREGGKRERERESKSVHDQNVIICYPSFDVTDYLTKLNLK